MNLLDADIRFSHLRHMARSPAHYRHAVLCGGSGQTLAKRLGSGAHAATFGTPEIAVWPGRRAGKAWDAFEAEHAAAGRLVLNERENAEAHAMAAALRSDPVVGPVLFGDDMVYEQQIEWSIKLNGRTRRATGRIDALGSAILLDLKALRDATPDRVRFVIERMGYHAQATWYADGCEAAGLGYRAPAIVVVENVAPYPCVLFHLSARAIEKGRALYRGWLERLASCEASNAWPGYVQSATDFDLPDNEPFRLDIDGEAFDFDTAAA